VSRKSGNGLAIGSQQKQRGNVTGSLGKGQKKVKKKKRSGKGKNRGAQWRNDQGKLDTEKLSLNPQGGQSPKVGTSKVVSHKKGRTGKRG